MDESRRLDLLLVRQAENRNRTRPRITEAAWKQGLRLRAANVTPRFAELQAPHLGQTWDETPVGRTAPWEAPAALARRRGRRAVEARAGLRELRVRDHHQAEQDHLHSSDRCAEGSEENSVVEEDDRAVVGDDLLGYAVERRACLDARRPDAVRDDQVEAGVRVAAVVAVPGGREEVDMTVLGSALPPWKS
jgi:hypothetical protein